MGRLVVFSTHISPMNQISHLAGFKSPVVDYKTTLVKWMLMCLVVTNVRHTASLGLSSLLLNMLPQDLLKGAAATVSQGLTEKNVLFNGISIY